MDSSLWLRKPLFRTANAPAALAPPLPAVLPCGFGTAFGGGNLYAAPQPHQRQRLYFAPQPHCRQQHWPDHSPDFIPISLLPVGLARPLAAEALSNSREGMAEPLVAEDLYFVGEPEAPAAEIMSIRY